MNEMDLGPRVPINTHHPVGYAHAYPTRRPITLATISARWGYWSDRAVLASKRASDPAEEFSRLRFLHNMRLERLLSSGLAWTSITRRDLDSPFQYPLEFDRALSIAIKARLRHIRIEAKKRSRKVK